ncbi:hypothetical protein [Ralstonia pseudosolanacearum]|uniref:hypothetical protein n=1 Tax=Ralstonia pseudosolanacearum TaxID=1310165 RepID=UPI001268663D|nr:hypothetical protein [Ralstonia pseudosolanacearum]MDO3556385.1 hypothetical protein [Ralstonia pseudosolanacearum]MDO3576036.1 hypothetical protein [Ralstonia pseudosolanacearum]MDO3585783.1 hypothetical protein [Ralstonia pseudosolanacearum]
MKIQDQDFYHGVALTQITEHKSFKALNRGSSKYGHYLINTDRHVFVKYRKPNGVSWNHTISPDEVKTIAAACKKDDLVWLCLVCGGVTICALDKAELNTVIDLSSTDQQWIRVDVPKGGGCRVSGSTGAVKKVIPHNAFPSKLFT